LSIMVKFKEEVRSQESGGRRRISLRFGPKVRLRRNSGIIFATFVDSN